MLPSLPKFCCPSLGLHPLELCTPGKLASPVLVLRLIAQSLTLYFLVEVVTLLFFKEIKL